MFKRVICDYLGVCDNKDSEKLIETLDECQIYKSCKSEYQQCEQKCDPSDASCLNLCRKIMFDCLTT